LTEIACTILNIHKFTLRRLSQNPGFWKKKQGLPNRSESIYRYFSGEKIDLQGQNSEIPGLWNFSQNPAGLENIPQKRPRAVFPESLNSD
jgi:hypothetical protein